MSVNLLLDQVGKVGGGVCRLDDSLRQGVELVEEEGNHVGTDPQIGTGLHEGFYCI
ncbi:MAG: hypothetical protein WA705_13085 [Candidatus Ozemobacteraceae bacterium]